MPRMLRGGFGALLAIAVVVPATKAPAQVPSPPAQNQQVPGQQKECFHRLEEMRVELALLEDPSLFPYSLATTYRGDYLELYGFVPSDTIRRRVLDVARRSTTLKIHETLGLRPELKPQPAPRAASVLHKEGTELLQQELGDTVKQLSLDVRTNNIVVMTGQIDSMENKVRASRLLHQLPGCCGVINKLTVEEIVHDGQPMFRVMHDDSLLAPVSVTARKSKPIAVSPIVVTSMKPKPKPIAVSPAPVVSLKPKPAAAESVPAGAIRLKPIAAPASARAMRPKPIAAPQPTLQRTTNLDAQKGELTLPTAARPQQASARLTPVPPKIDRHAGEFAPSKLPVKWGHPANGWETQVSDLKTMQPDRQQALMPTPVNPPKRSPEPERIPTPAAARETNRAIAVSRPVLAEKPPSPAVVWRRPGGAEESEPKSPAPATTVPEESTNTLPSIHSSRRWPPAYVTAPPPSQGRAGVIVFEEEPSRPKPAMGNPAPARPIATTDLQRQVKSVCGREAREVTVSVQRDGSVLVKVKVANRSIEDRLSRKILAMPEMTSPRVRLMMEIAP